MGMMWSTAGILFLFIIGNINTFVTANDEEECKSGLMKCKLSSKCIPLSWKCDGDADCDDMSDEENCPPKTCADAEHLCDTNGTCIPERWKCDGETDCPGGEDENATICADTAGCGTDEFPCGDGLCISNNWKCDGVEDCSDGVDEKNCHQDCPAENFLCSDGKQCIANAWVCDRDKDCTDGSDENNCPEIDGCPPDKFMCNSTRKCIDLRWFCDGDFDCQDHSDENNANCTRDIIDDGSMETCDPESDFHCKTGECIHISWKCDGDIDCEDGSDEGEDFCVYECKEDKFQCHNHNCIPKSLECDEYEDCLDGSDELNCTKHITCAEKGEFDCYGDNSYCIPNNKVCDGHNDCDHREDEETSLCKHKDPCDDKKCPDHSTCQNIPITYNKLNATCVCDHGFKWHAAEHVCKDINECEERGVCSQICSNTKGGYKCECRPGYVLERHYFCRAEGEEAWLYYANRRDIRKLRVDSRYEDIVVNATTNSVALDIDHKENLMFYTDSGAEVIKRLKITHSENGSEIIEQSTVIITNNEKSAFAADGIAVDWLYKHIYWTDTGSNKIKVSTYDGHFIKTLISTGLDEPRAIALDPENGLMYWTDWGKEAKIERCGMDGNNRKTLISKGDGLQWPNGLTIDYVDKRLYWIDSKLHKIGSTNMDGTDYYHVLVDAREIQRPFSISVFEDSLYWTDWHSNSIRSVNKITGHSPTTLSLGSYSVMGIKVYHALKQDRAFSENATTLCKNAQCGELCLPEARINPNITQTVTCACSDGRELNADQKTCRQSAIVPTTQKPSTAGPVTTQKVVVPSSSGQTTQGGYTVLPTTAKPSNETGTGHTEGQPSGQMAIIVAVCVALVFCLVAVVGFLVYRKYKNRNKKSMHFDNPVYRKTTTDDQCMITDENVPPQMQRLTSHESV